MTVSFSLTPDNSKIKFFLQDLHDIVMCHWTFYIFSSLRTCERQFDDDQLANRNDFYFKFLFLSANTCKALSTCYFSLSAFAEYENFISFTWSYPRLTLFEERFI